MGFFMSAVSTLQTLIVALGAGGALSTFWKGMVATIRARMGRVHKEATIQY